MRFAGSAIGRWFGASLGRRLALTLSAGLVLGSAVFLGLFVELYRGRLIEERGSASAQVNRLLQVSLENAMLKRDLDGLREIVDGLGRQDQITRVMIVDPVGEIRFASRPEMLGARLDLPGAGAAGRPPVTATTTFVTDEGGDEVLRSINPVLNREPCTQCHGPLEAHPVNGVLVVDYDANGIKGEAVSSALMLSGSGVAVVILAIAGTWLALHRSVVRPVQAVTAASRALAGGDLAARTTWRGDDEVAELGRSFNQMAARLQQSLDAVRERKAFLQALIDAIPDGIRVIDQEFGVRLANTAYCRQVGRSLDEVVGRPCYESSHGRGEPCAPTLVTCPLHELRGRSEGLTCRHRHVAADGSALFVEVSAAPLHLTLDGRRQSLVVEAIRDLAQEMKLSHEQKLSEIGLLATGVAHEIRNPLASIHLSIRGLRRNVVNGDAIRLAEHMTIIDDEIGKCIQVTDRLLRLSVPPSERPTLVSLNDVIPEVLSLLGFEAAEAGVVVATRLAENLRVIGSDSDMRMVVLNLAQNAFHAMPEGGRLDVIGAVVDGQIELTFADTGVGISPADLPRIFDPFWSRRADRVSGTGLGLSICKAILHQCEGAIEVHSEVARGTRMVVRLPHADSVSHAA